MNKYMTNQLKMEAISMKNPSKNREYLEIGNWKPENGDWKLEIELWRPENGDQHLENGAQRAGPGDRGASIRSHVPEDRAALSSNILID